MNFWHKTLLGIALALTTTGSLLVGLDKEKNQNNHKASYQQGIEAIRHLVNERNLLKQNLKDASSFLEQVRADRAAIIKTLTEKRGLLLEEQQKIAHRLGEIEKFLEQAGRDIDADVLQTLQKEVAVLVQEKEKLETDIRNIEAIFPEHFECYPAPFEQIYGTGSIVTPQNQPKQKSLIKKILYAGLIIAGASLAAYGIYKGIRYLRNINTTVSTNNTDEITQQINNQGQKIQQLNGMVLQMQNYIQENPSQIQEIDAIKRDIKNINQNITNLQSEIESMSTTTETNQLIKESQKKLLLLNNMIQEKIEMCEDLKKELQATYAAAIRLQLTKTDINTLGSIDKNPNDKIRILGQKNSRFLRTKKNFKRRGFFNDKDPSKTDYDNPNIEKKKIMKRLNSDGQIANFIKKNYHKKTEQFRHQETTDSRIDIENPFGSPTARYYLDE